MIKFNQTEVDIGVIEPGSKHVVEFTFEGGIPSDIIHLHPHCGCTADLVTINNKVQAKFTEKDAAKADIAKLKNQFPTKQLPFTKTISAYLNDGKLLKVPNPNGPGKILNPNKSKILLKFAGKVDLSKLWEQ